MISKANSSLHGRQPDLRRQKFRILNFAPHFLRLLWSVNAARNSNPEILPTQVRFSTEQSTLALALVKNRFKKYCVVKGCVPIFFVKSSATKKSFQKFGYILIEKVVLFETI
jgi:hypothetical protein